MEGGIHDQLECGGRCAECRRVAKAKFATVVDRGGQLSNERSPGQPCYGRCRLQGSNCSEAGRNVSVEDPERRVLVLVNPGHRSPEGISADPAVFLGLQLVLPGGSTYRHRHSAGACRFIIEGQHASTLVNGERFRMEPGYLILTLPHHWHEHIHEGTDPVIGMVHTN